MNEELEKARRVAKVMDDFLAAIEPVTMYEYTNVCPKCGAHEIGMSRRQPAQAEYSGVCRRCSRIEP